jgi:hypothetical protein
MKSQMKPLRPRVPWEPQPLFILRKGELVIVTGPACFPFTMTLVAVSKTVKMASVLQPVLATAMRVADYHGKERVTLRFWPTAAPDARWGLQIPGMGDGSEILVSVKIGAY